MAEERMKGRMKRLQWASLVLRLVAAMQICAASAGFFLHKPAQWSTEGPSSWIGPPLPHFASWIGGVGLALLAIASLLGLYKRISLLISSLLLLALSWIHLYFDPLYNLSEAILLLLLNILGILWIEDQRMECGPTDSIQLFLPESTRAWSAFVLRLFVGGIFVSQGFHDLFRHGGVIEFARNVYVRPFHGRLPDWTLWIAGVSNPPWELGGGLLLVSGFFTEEACLGMCAFLLTVIFGHCLNDFGGATSGMRDYALANLLCVLLVYATSHQNAFPDGTRVRPHRPFSA